MAKTTTVTMVTRKQQLSKILMSQLIADLKRRISGSDDPMAAAKESWLVKMHAHGRRFGGFGVEDEFDVRITYLRRGAIKVAYCNNQGMISAVFDAAEVDCIFSLLHRKAESIIAREVDAAIDRRIKRQQDHERCIVMEHTRELVGQVRKLQEETAELRKLFDAGYEAERQRRRDAVIEAAARGEL